MEPTDCSEFVKAFRALQKTSLAGCRDRRRLRTDEPFAVTKARLSRVEEGLRYLSPGHYTHGAAQLAEVIMEVMEVAEFSGWELASMLEAFVLVRIGEGVSGGQPRTR